MNTRSLPKAGLLFASAAALIGPAMAAAKPTIETREIRYDVDGQTFKGILAFDKSITAKRPGVLVCHEWWGNNDYSASRARQLAELGYVAFALDVYGAGKVTTSPEQAGKWAGELYDDMDAMRNRARAGLKVLTEQKMVDAGNIAAIGYCFGGTVALELARTGADLGAVVCFHTSSLAAADPAMNENIKARVLICHGAADPLTKTEELEKFTKQMEGANVKYEIKHYAGAKHSFTNPGAGDVGMEAVGYNAEADKASWQDMRSLFAATIGAPDKMGNGD